jgi:hypothetical protein
VLIVDKLGRNEDLRGLDSFAEEITPYESSPYAETEEGEVMRVSKVIHAWAARLNIQEVASAGSEAAGEEKE